MENTNKLKIAAVADLHIGYQALQIPKCDVLVVAGDYSNSGELVDLAKFISWCENQPATHKLVVPGNHDMHAERQPALTKRMFKDAGIEYLCDSGTVIAGKTFWGTPWTPRFGNWAFMGTEEKLANYFLQMPENLDLLISHGGPKGYLDQVGARSCGSTSLLKTLLFKKPKAMVYGHIHDAHGQTVIDVPKSISEKDKRTLTPTLLEAECKVKAYNVSVCDDNYEITWEPTIIEV